MTGAALTQIKWFTSGGGDNLPHSPGGRGRTQVAITPDEFV
jgi:hypothetical protein